MSELTLEDLVRILRECAGEGEDVPEDCFADTAFDELGYDSLAVLETAGRLKRDHGVELSDEEVSDTQTPRDLFELALTRWQSTAAKS